MEGKKDSFSLQALGFTRIFLLNSGLSLRETLENISKKIEKKDKICILTDFDKKGKHLYKEAKRYFSENGAKIDTTLRSLIRKEKLSHIEGVYKAIKD